MRTLCIIVTAIGVGISPAAWADPLAAGKPAGVHTAQMTDKEWMVFGGIGIAAAAVAIAVSGGRSSSANSSQPISVITTSATAV